eukprot:scaffold261_cov336-Pavlova_lutheri.AAC.19
MCAICSFLDKPCRSALVLIRLAHQHLTCVSPCSTEHRLKKVANFNIRALAATLSIWRYGMSGKSGQAAAIQGTRVYPGHGCLAQRLLEEHVHLLTYVDVAKARL